MPRTPRSNHAADAAVNDTAVSPDPAIDTDAVSQDASRSPRRRPARRRSAATAGPAVEQPAVTDDATPPPSVPESPLEPEVEPAPEADAAVLASAADAPAVDSLPVEPTRRPRGRRRVSARSTEVAAADAPAIEPEVQAAAPAAPPAEPDVPEAERTAAPAEPSLATAGAVDPDSREPEAAPEPAAAVSWSAAPANSWTTGRPWVVGPDGKVRFVDELPPESAPAPVAADAPEPDVEPEAVSQPAAITAADVEDVTDEEALLAPDEVVFVEADMDVAEEGESVGVADETSAEVGSDLDTGEAATVQGDGDAAPIRRRRRSRRGGRGRNRNGAASLATAEELALIAGSEPAVEAPPESEPEPEPAPAAGIPHRPVRTAPSRTLLEDLMARQNVILDQLTQRQAAMAKSMEHALLAVENRLKGTDLSRVSAMPRLGVFVDVPNIMYAAERYNVAVDFGKLLDYVSHDRTLIRASAYAPISDDPAQRLEMQRFVQPFVSHGYRIVTKPLKRFADGSIKANFDVELAMDILTMSDRLDIVSLVSGDGDFRRLVEIVASKGVRVEVVAFSQSTASELKAIADSYVDLTLHLKDLCVPIEGEVRPRIPRPRSDLRPGMPLDL